MLNLETFRPQFTKILDHLKVELGSLRTGRANAAILDTVQVQVYGQSMLLKSVSSISVPDARTITVEPWDKSILKDVEKAILDAKLGVNPVNEGQLIRLPMPSLTEESRKDLLKILNQKLEHARITTRQQRDTVRDKIVQEEKEKLIGEDQRFRLQQKLDEMVKEINDKIKAMGEEKEKEIMTV
ncbi:MAG: Ribosome-recycling factor [Candidatus Magasanikbacteria bacterium GW2011_GWC2_41_17]|uniref:Ribosome-recycling factor n=2 Tax=Candidatus Magasanikiibacteriota TaxID=1752731 RepID=A0A0G0WNB1_9BACT|nr:MAG: Ribosome-recycling factor [Candidatus Magasanikbacteria bacterium GW2011_GWC2_41_17]KKS13567.1 MAG: Ribosome-recycling factor [Candidatus Magasanikbacteria bacterium GW2011_GWA2_41_55]HBX16211.1 ribosome recycling factor [Candidatus Magasanikbacteria bacterium]